jgi:hypothetical protein
MKQLAHAFILVFVITVWAISAAAQVQNSVVACRVGSQAPAFGFWTWAANSRVKVYIRSSDFAAAEVPYLLTPLRNWDAASAETGSGVRFNYQGGALEQELCENCLTIMRGQVFDRTTQHATELRVFSARGDQIITYAAIVIDYSLTNPRTLTNAVAHELGHNLGLLDCYTCKRRSTVMNQFRAMNVVNDMEGPTDCDKAQVRAAYLALRVHVGPSPARLVAESLGVDEGEEPVADDTPVVTPGAKRRP